MSSLLNERTEANQLFQRAEKQWADGKLHAAFRLFLLAAKAGFLPAFDTVAQFYDAGTGVKTNLDAALYWYERAYREGESWYKEARDKSLSTAANNIGCICRDRGHAKKALLWFRRAVQLGDGDANLQIAKIYLRSEHDLKKAIGYLQGTIKADYVTDGSLQEAKALLKEIRSKRLRRTK